MLHIGHMYILNRRELETRYIQGRKMSKSLKNFITSNRVLLDIDNS